MRKYVLATFLAALTGLAISGLVHAAGTTKLTNVQVTGTLAVTGATSHTGNVTHTGTIYTSATTPYGIVISSKTAAIPAGVGVLGALAVDSTYVLYIGTGTGVGAWVKVGGQ